MTGRVLNSEFVLVSIVDTFESFIWTDRYNEAGDFELYTEASQKNFSIFIPGYYLEIEESDKTMIIETLETQSDPEQGTKLVVSGRSLESILDRRIIYSEFSVASSSATKPLWKCVKTCLNKCLLSGGDANANRVISNFSFTDPVSTDAVYSINIDDETQCSAGDNLYDIIVNFCQDKHVGFKIIRSGDQFVMSLYLGTDRSYNQTSVPFVVFSYNFDNVVNLDYLNSYQPYKNTALVVGEGNASDSVKVEVYEGGTSTAFTGLNRRETMINPENCTRGDKTLAKYKELLKSKGVIELSTIDYCISKVFSGEIEARTLFKYGEDFKIGDVVEVGNEFGVSNHCRITEFVRSEDSSGYTYTPTFVDISTEK